MRVCAEPAGFWFQTEFGFCAGAAATFGLGFGFGFGFAASAAGAGSGGIVVASAWSGGG
jgi:hypothetical protein